VGGSVEASSGEELSMTTGTSGEPASVTGLYASALGETPVSVAGAASWMCPPPTTAETGGVLSLPPQATRENSRHEISVTKMKRIGYRDALVATPFPFCWCWCCWC
jgi:hypothetical protein